MKMNLAIFGLLMFTVFVGAGCEDSREATKVDKDPNVVETSVQIKQ
jgi:hypothetical protein